MKIVIMMIFVVAAVIGRAADRVIESSGIGDTYRLAVNEALVSALERASGVTLSATERAAVDSSEVSVMSSSGDVDKVTINDSITKNMQKWADGKISGYEVLSERFDPQTRKYDVRLSVRIPGPYVVGNDPENRRRMAVVPFRPMSGDSVSWFGQSESSAAWASMIADRINERLTQTRKFTMVDRKFDAEINAELSRLSAPNASKADAVRLNQKLGTDYLVVGEIRSFPVAAPAVNPLTGQEMPVASQRLAEVSYRVLLAPTGQLKWSDTVTIDAADYQFSDIGSFLSVTADGVAAKIAGEMMSNILPYEITAVTASGRIVIGEGGKSIAEGERFTVFALGEMTVDSRTGEELDQIEEPVGTVEVERVTEKLSYAKVIEGDAKQMVVGCRLRQPKVVAVPKPSVPALTTIKVNGSGGVVTPF